MNDFNSVSPSASASFDFVGHGFVKVQNQALEQTKKNWAVRILCRETKKELVNIILLLIMKKRPVSNQQWLLST